MNLLLIDDDNIDRENSIRALNRSRCCLNITEVAFVEEEYKIEQELRESQKELQFLEAINAFSKTLGILTVVEGVEITAQKEWCKELIFDPIQGGILQSRCLSMNLRYFFQMRSYLCENIYPIQVK
ncbi:hypothetical protein [Kiloniella litopenaei]|uniref:hypothetical protein n=1 Tax=Kiloniella litopenaei TaxID=1549748 RepID=UPI003BACFA1F